LRILKVIQFYFPFQEMGGPVFKVRALARKLVGLGHDVTILTADLGLRGNILGHASYSRCEWGFSNRDCGVQTIYLKTVARYRALTLNPMLYRYSNTALNAFDVIHFYGIYDLFGPIVSAFCRKRNLPYVVEPLGMYRPIDRGFAMKRAWHSTLGKSYLKKAQRIVATSALEFEEIAGSGVSRERLVVRHNGIDSETFLVRPPRGIFRRKWHLPANEPIVLFLSRLIRRKNPDLLIRAFASALPSTGRLIIAGPEGERGYTRELQDLATGCGIASRVVFPGPLYDEAKVEAMVDADIFVLASRYENFANAPAEALACGVPVVVSDSCGVSSLIAGRAGLVVEPKLEPLVAALATLLSDRKLYGKFAEGCRTVAEELGWDKLTRRMEDIYVEATQTQNLVP
jgi:glycosyltransferase involved in cell wall biosynthesis